MPTEALARDETPQMRLTSALLESRDRGDLPHFLASRRLPGLGWRTWDQIATELATETGVEISREGVHRWAQRYGVPRSEQHDGPEYIKIYREKLAALGITV